MEHALLVINRFHKPAVHLVSTYHIIFEFPSKRSWLLPENPFKYSRGCQEVVSECCLFGYFREYPPLSLMAHDIKHTVEQTLLTL